MAETYLPLVDKQGERVIITATDVLEARQWRHYLITNWDRLTRKNSRILILAGVHGSENGCIGPSDAGLFKDNQGQLRVLKHKLHKEIEENNIDIALEDVGKHMNPDVLDEDKLVTAIKAYNPTLLILGFCYSQGSELNDILRGAGIYDEMVPVITMYYKRM
jgi:hypothetical protein